MQRANRILSGTRPAAAPASRRARHVAIIMDGNGRWATARGLPRIAGHREGANAVGRTVEAAPELGIETLTLYAFSSDNWSRPPDEVSALMDLLERYLDRECARCVRHGIRLGVIGRRDRLRPGLVAAIRGAEQATEAGSALRLRLAVDYSSRHAIVEAARRSPKTPEAFYRTMALAMHSDPAAPDVDLLVRTSGEKRLSDFLLWECAYAEFVFIDRHWPDFARRDLADAIEEFRRRDRRYGGVRQVV